MSRMARKDGNQLGLVEDILSTEEDICWSKNDRPPSSSGIRAEAGATFLYGLFELVRSLANWVGLSQKSIILWGLMFKGGTQY